MAGPPVLTIMTRYAYAAFPHFFRRIAIISLPYQLYHVMWNALNNTKPSTCMQPRE